jgi:cysteine desulfurase/selenocysteine lyase
LSGLELDYAKAEELITTDTALVSVMLASNVTGVVNDVRRIADLAHKKGAIMVVDATAAMGHFPVNVGELGCDALYFSGHKMMAPTGVGVLWMARALQEKLTPASFGGHMIESVDRKSATWGPIPERFEAGTKNIAGVIGLGAAIDYLNNLNLALIHRHLGMLAFMAVQKLEQIDGVKVYSPCDPTKNSGIVSFAADWAHPHDIADILARDRIAVRPGHHCAEPLHHALGVPATVRASFHVYNTKDDVEALVEGVKKARGIFGQ